MTPTVVFDGAHLRLLHLDRRQQNLIVTFDFRTAGKADFGPVNPSRAFARAGFDQLMVKTRQNDWFINAETAEMEALLGPLTARYDRVHTLGYSMGGYGAFRFARTLRADWVVAVSPQVSIAPDVVPFDRRYRAESAGFDPKIGAIPAMPGLGGAILFDPFVRHDLRHAQMLQALCPGIRLCRAAFGGHPASQTLRDAGRAGVIQRVALRAVAPERMILAHRAARRLSERYITRLSRATGDRWPGIAARLTAPTPASSENGDNAGDSG